MRRTPRSVKASQASGTTSKTATPNMNTQAEPLLPSSIPTSSPSNNDHSTPAPSAVVRKTPWLALAAASGACAAFNGVFAKLTTTALTTHWSTTLSHALHLPTPNRPLEFFFRATFFLLNLGFNALMWALFTAALTRASSTTRVSIINTSSNFVITALLGLVVFGERLPALWWVGAAGLVVGNVVIGRREEEGGSGGDDVSLKEADRGEGVEGYRDQEVEIERDGDGEGDGERERDVVK